MIAEKFIFVKTTKEIIHKYPDAPKGVEFLRYPHRHILHIKTYINVEDDNREIEFILFKRKLNNILSTKGTDFNYKSLEMISNNLADDISKLYPNRKIMIELSEDGENGTFITYN